MPFTFNGIGTMYYGKRKTEDYEGVCQSCGQTGRLKAYETRLWFTVLYVPIVPLAREQVVDYCPYCSAHRAISLEQWYRLKEQTPVINPGEHEHAGSASPEFHEPEGSAEAIDNHLNALYPGNEEEAESMAREMDLKFAESLDVQLYLGSYYLRRNKEKEAFGALERALRLDPENQWARRHVGITCLRKRNLTRARQLLSYLLKSHTDQDAGVILELGTALWEAQRYSEAYAYFDVLARDFKSLASKNRKYRRMVKDTESRTGSGRSILPQPAIIKWAALAGIVVIVLLGILYAAQVKAKQKTLHVVNGLNVKAVFSIPGKEQLVLRPMSRSWIDLNEGEYDASVKIKNRPGKTVKITLSDGWWERMSNPSLFVFNIEGAAVITWEKVRYSENPRDDDPYYYRLYVGEPLITFKEKEVHFLFTSLPETIRLPSGESGYRVRLGFQKDSPEDMAGELITTMVPPKNTLTFLESHLHVNREREALLKIYLAVGEVYNNQNHCITFLEKELPRRPVLVDWHRTYQGFREAKGETDQLVAQYDAFLEQEPGNSALLYLRGRVAKNTTESFAYYDKAAAADPKNPFPYFAKANYLYSLGEFTTAWELFDRACALHPRRHSLKDNRYNLRFAVGELESLQLKLSLRIDGKSTDWGSFRKLMELLVVQDKTTIAKNKLGKFRKALKKEYKKDALPYEMEAQLQLDYLLKDFDAMKKHQLLLEDESRRNSYLTTIYLNRGDMEKLDALPDITTNSNGYDALLFWLGWMEKEDPEKASQWLKGAKEYFLYSTDAEMKQVGLWLAKPGPGITAKLDTLPLFPEWKRILYTAFSRLYPPERRRLLSRAEKLNFFPRFPYHFLKRIINNAK